MFQDKVFWVMRSMLLGNDYSGTVILFFNAADFETIIKEIQDARDLNNELSTLIESSADGLVISDHNGILLKMNPAYEAMTGVNADDFIGLPAKRLVNEGHLHDLVTRQVLETKKAATMIQEIRGREILFTGTPVFDSENKLIRVIANIRDLTELNSLSRQLHAIREEVKFYHDEMTRLKIESLKSKVIANSVEMHKVLETSLRVAPMDATVLLLGESGVGKKVIAQLIYEFSKRFGKPFIKINCGALPPSLIESELFGYEEGAFTGAKRTGSPGVFEMASGGTLLLDEIGDLGFDLQVKLLRLLQEREVTRIGGKKPIPIDVRLITSTNQNLENMVNENKFRKDLFYRLNVVSIMIPPLRSRPADIPPLATHFVHHFAKKYNMTRRISPDLMKAFVEYDWPGNIRELENTVERLVILSLEESLDISLFTANRETRVSPAALGSLKLALEETEKKLIIQAYNLFGSTRKAAAALGINQSTVVRKLQQYGHG
ncbi:sigma 54-interacting transcriptional regulator [Sporomusa sphaeroides DSM 2875]|uniref:sigma-54 interaction domain-containing protein n=1 Tax=Sporomusa sphaeroides TaxID=47679 RepID=UPI00202E987E|nr:sigma 54-interacting transcriptional regulator [Sporomusa sphaeroides]MCM0759495.1 sigma 54-interacting transcriptional regulator [Sporomusa sphaeroides DSM 2875]